MLGHRASDKAVASQTGSIKMTLTPKPESDLLEATRFLLPPAPGVGVFYFQGGTKACQKNA